MTEEKSFSMTVQERDALIVEQLPPFTEGQLKEVENDIKRYITGSDNRYFMLLSRDINYYTLFKSVTANKEALAKEIFEFLTADWFTLQFGKMKVCKEVEGKIMEIWIDNTVFLLFEADQLVVEA